MAHEVELTLGRISEKSRLLVERYKTVVRERSEALARIAELESQLQMRDKELDRLRTANEYLTIASNVATDKETLGKTRAMLSDLVREIDRCIADLND